MIDDKKLGLRIVSEDYKTLEDSQITFLARGDKNQLVPAKVLVSVNGEEKEVVSLNSLNTEEVTVNYSRNLNLTDKVEVTFLNPDVNQSAFVSYLKVNGKFCYQKPVENQDDAGMFVSFQTISSSTSCETSVTTPFCQPGNLKSAPYACTTSDNQAGELTCNETGSHFACVETGECASGFTKVGAVCVPQICSPNTVSSCPVANGTGSKTCSVSGLGFGSCQVSSCNAGSYLSGGACVPQVCSPGSSVPCVSNHFIGTRTCSTEGSGFNLCVASSTCESGYYNQSGVCLPQVCSPGTQSSCSISNGSGVRTCNTDGSAQNSCSVSSCQSGYHVNGATSEADTISCSVSNGAGTKTWNGSGYGSCQVASCSSGFTSNGSACMAQSCSPNSTQSCSITNGSGVRTCSSDGMTLGSCQVAACSAGYHQEGVT